MALRRAHILFKDHLAGQVKETPAGGTVFTYEAGWQAPIACALPIAERWVAWAGGLHPVFQNLGAEGWLRQRQARAGRVEGEDDLGLLLRHGRDCIGALSVVPEAGEAPPAPEV
ncbi:MAG: HipA N-terminal domain-containing protein, partial [Rhodospirillales bacterium]|nr:HipA N-terminal domain-containing protein [Rhodospirillales bacterium]